VTENLKQLAVNWINDNTAFLIETHEKIWKWAEVGLQEFKTAEHIMGLLDAKGFTNAEWQECLQLSWQLLVQAVPSLGLWVN
jgi:metal-dependent amidase/aminoacylase/carboxypeptidase family protein